MMKIHEKLLTHYLSCPSPVDKEGYLYKKVGPFPQRYRLLLVQSTLKCMRTVCGACSVFKRCSLNGIGHAFFLQNPDSI